MDIERTFHPVGQGGFFTEEVSGFRAVYDCGSATSLVTLKDQIDKYRGDRIDVLFISHFDTDHVNGLEYLLQQCNVDKVVLPLIGHEERIRLAVKYYNNHSCRFMSEFSLDPAEFIRRTCKEADKDTEVIFVAPYQHEQDLPDDNSFDEDSDAPARVVPSGHHMQVPSKKIPWVFIPFNFDGENRSKSALIALSKLGITINSVNDFKRHWVKPSDKKNIINAYKSVKGDPNTNSLALYSGPESGNDKNRFGRHRCIHRRKRHSFQVPYYRPACLFLGDYDAQGKRKWDQLREAYHYYWRMVGTVQIPHHGSKDNYNEELYSDRETFCVIASGLQNKHKHPHIDTLKSILSHEGIPIWVTEDQNSICQFQIHYRTP